MKFPVTLVLVSCVLSGCIGGSRSRLRERAALRADAGPADVAFDGIVLQDAARRDAVFPNDAVLPNDAVVPNDANIPDVDPVRPMCGYDDFDGLVGPACFPRCSMATLDEVMRCQGQDCFEQALSNDDTPALRVEVTGEETDVACFECFQLQQLPCVAQACPNEYQEFIECRDDRCGGDQGCAQMACFEESDQINECLNRQPDDIGECVQNSVLRCFFG